MDETRKGLSAGRHKKSLNLGLNPSLLVESEFWPVAETQPQSVEIRRGF